VWGVGSTPVQRGCARETVMLRLRNLCKALAVIDHHDDDYGHAALHLSRVLQYGHSRAAPGISIAHSGHRPEYLGCASLSWKISSQTSR